MAFYKEDNKKILKANNIVGPGFQLFEINKNEFSYPHEGWYWFETDEEAEDFFGISLNSPTPQNPPQLPEFVKGPRQK